MYKDVYVIYTLSVILVPHSTMRIWFLSFAHVVKKKAFISNFMLMLHTFEVFYDANWYDGSKDRNVCPHMKKRKTVFEKKFQHIGLI